MTVDSQQLIQIVTLLGAAVIAVPFFKKIGLGPVLGYLAAGLIIGPFGLKLFNNPTSIIHVAEFGVVMFLFVIGLEMQPGHLWSMRKDIFGLGSIQIFVCTLVLTGILLLLKFSLLVSFISAMGFVLTSTAIVFQILAEKNEIGSPQGQKIISILLFEDLLIVPLLALVAFLSPVGAHDFSYTAILYPLLAIVGVVAAGIWLLNPLFRLLARSRIRELLTAAALLIVLGSALIMQVSGLSMAMGAFMAGVLLSESSFRHQIEADIEPFRGILLGLFFMGVGMSLDLLVVKENIVLILSAVTLMMFAKGICIYLIAKYTGTTKADSLDRAVLMSQGGEFAFVLYAAATQFKVIDAKVNAQMTSIIVLSMILTPIIVVIVKKLTPSQEKNLDNLDHPNDENPNVLLIGFGRFGQVASQLLLARDFRVTIIDSDPERIRNAKNFGFHVFFGDGSQLNVLKASGAEKAKIIAICIDNKEVTTKIVKLLKHEFPKVKIVSRAYDRIHARELTYADTDYVVRETFESAIHFGKAALRFADIPENEILATADDIRKRDHERFLEEIANNDLITSNANFLHSNIITPTPLVDPKREGKDLTK